MPASFMCFTISLPAPPTPITYILLMVIKLVIITLPKVMLIQNKPISELSHK